MHSITLNKNTYIYYTFCKISKIDIDEDILNSNFLYYFLIYKQINWKATIEEVN